MTELFPDDKIEFDILYLRHGELAYTGIGTVSHLNTGTQGEVGVNVNQYRYPSGKIEPASRGLIVSVKVKRIRKIK